VNASGATDPDFLAQMHLLRSRVGAELPMPAIILVTSAARGDGKSLVAHSLAESFLQAGNRAALVHLTRDRTERNELPEVASELDDGNTGGGGRIEALATKLRAAYDFTIVDGGILLQGSGAISLAPLVDGVLIAVRVGRSPTDDDDSMMHALQRAGARVVGVVAAEVQAITEFANVH